jgi:hypothetical protein
MTSQTFKVVGITENNNNAKVRFTQDVVRRVKQFSKGGCTRIDFIELPQAMTKIEALKYMLTHPSFQSDEDQATIADTLADKEKELRKGTIRIKNELSLDSIKKRPRNDVTVSDILDVVNS